GRGEVRHGLAVRSLAAREEAIRLRAADEVARRVAFAAMPQRLHQVGAAVDGLRGARDWRKRARGEVEPLPDGDRPAPAEEEPQVVLLARLRARRQRAQVRPQVAHVGVGDLGERRVRESGKVVGPVRPVAPAERAHEIGFGPVAEARGLVRRDVRSEEGSERRLQAAAAREWHRAFLVLGMAADAAGGLSGVLAALCVARRERASGEEGKENEAEARHGARIMPQAKRKPRSSGAFFRNACVYCCFSRKFWWQPPQALPTPPIAAFCAASSPPRDTETRFATALVKVASASLNLAGSLQIAGRAAFFTVASLLAGANPSQGMRDSASSSAAFIATVSAL